MWTSSLTSGAGFKHFRWGLTSTPPVHSLAPRSPWADSGRYLRVHVELDSFTA